MNPTSSKLALHFDEGEELKTNQLTKTRDNCPRREGCNRPHNCGHSEAYSQYRPEDWSLFLSTKATITQLGLDGNKSLGEKRNSGEQRASQKPTGPKPRHRKSWLWDPYSIDLGRKKKTLTKEHKKFFLWLNVLLISVFYIIFLSFIGFEGVLSFFFI